MSRRFNRLFILVCLLSTMMQCQAMQLKTDNFMRRLIVAFLALSSPSVNSVDVRSTPLQMATIYFDGQECAPRCIATQADWLGPIQAFCSDEPGCVNMFLSGAEQCDVDPTYVGEYNCSILQKKQTTKHYKRKKRS